MEEKNEKISTFQLMTISIFIIDSLFVGLGIINVFSFAKQDAWLVSIVGMILNFIPMLILIYIMSYKPDKNILEKNTLLFGKVIGNIINILICIFVFVMLIIVIWSTTDFAKTMYLTKTPSIFIAFVFVFTAVYAVSEGIETIGRTCEIIFGVALVLLSIIAISLYFQSSFDLLKPTLAHGVMPLFKNSFMYLAYCSTPIILLGIIPKSDIVNNKKYNKTLLISTLVATSIMILVFYLIPAVITPKLAEIYRFPAYYVLRKISIGGAINNVENILGIHWFFNSFILMTMSIYFISKYVNTSFKIKKPLPYNVINMIIGAIAIILSINIFKNSTIALSFMQNIFSVYVSLILLVMSLIISIFIFFKKRKEKKATT